MPRIFPALIAFLALPASSQAVVLYTENFLNPTPASAKNFGSVGWLAHTGSTAIDRTSTSAVGSSDPAVIWTSVGRGSGAGYGFGALGGNVALYWTTEPGPVALASITSLTFFSNNSSTTNGLKFALRLDNNTPGDTSDDFWVVSTQTFNSTSSGSSGNWATNSAQEILNFDASAALWTNLTFTAGSTLSAASSARTSDLPGGNVTAFGIYAPTGGNVRFDDYTINVVPEPSAALLFSGALASLCLRRRR